MLTGTIGSGKTVLAAELGEILGERGDGVAVIDLDWLGWFHPPRDRPVVLEQLIATNLAAVWPSFRAAGARRLVLARMVQTASEVDRLKSALPDVDLTVVRVDASPATIEKRLQRRDTGTILEGHLSEAAAATRLLDEAALEDLRIDNDEGPVGTVASALLERLGWD